MPPSECSLISVRTGPGKTEFAPDPVLAEVQSHLVGQMVQPGLRRAVRRHGGDAAHAGQRRDVDDGASPVLDHVRDGELHGVERTGEVRLDHRVPDVGVEVHHGTPRIDGGVVDEDVDLAAERDGGLHHPLGVVELGHVAGAGRWPCPAGSMATRLSSLSCRRPVMQTFAPSATNRLAISTPMPAPAPGDHGHFAFEHHVQLLLTAFFGITGSDARDGYRPSR